MSQVRRASDPDYASVYEVATRWRNTSLLEGRSLFDGSVKSWSTSTASSLRQRIVDNPDESTGTFVEKLKEQMAGANQAETLLLAELVYIHLLVLNNVGLETKLSILNSIGMLAPAPFEVPDELLAPLSTGLVNGGVGYNSNRFYLVAFLLEFAESWCALPQEERAALLEDPWGFKKLLVGLPQERAAAQRNALQFLLFPMIFEDMVSPDHKARVVAAYADEASDDPDIDRQLLSIREALKGRLRDDFTWYAEDVRSTWDHDKQAAKPLAQAPSDSHLTRLEGAFEDSEGLKIFAATVALGIATAHAVDEASWSISQSGSGSGLSLNVGPNRAISIGKRGWSLMAVGEPTRVQARLARVGVETTARPFSFPDDVSLYKSVDPGALAPAIDVLKEEYVAAIRASAVRKTPYRRSFSESALEAIEKLTGERLPRPSRRATSGGAAWIVRVKIDGQDATRETLESGKTRIFWSVNVPPGSTVDVVKAGLLATYPELSNHQLGNQAGSIHRFITRMQVGDLVLMPSGAGLFLGTVQSEATFDPDLDEWSREVDWANADAPISRSDVSPALYSRLRTLLTVTEITPLIEEIESLLEATDDGPVALEPASIAEPRLRKIDSDLAAGWMLDRAWLDEIVEMLSAKKQLIFYGPPGTGKTYLAQRIAEHLTADGGNYRLVQFHPSYSYEDFIEGFRPQVNDQGEMSYVLKPGPLKEIADAAREDPGNPYLLLIDEINRGNLAKIFGELYFLLEYREQSLVLQYGSGTDDEFSLPKNLYVIGTMNTADRSIALVDAAIRRRFFFVEFSPTEPPISDLLRKWLAVHRMSDLPARLLDELNRRLDDTDYAVGPSYLMHPNVDQAPELERTWKHAIMPLLAEHFYGKRGATDRFSIAELRGSIEPPPAELDPTSSDAED
ncbi:5-methylcytosine-specific restriction enzyme B [Planctomycetes bacterium Poly30]|uniref:5-methylcytosine-specific restriction enzyme B n=1 Tax=Saltatorellus ferox TaxID=2528018 RepID=A0A518ETB1_9BACT|nr:5-methylcytosine-specific restriction enzyme B [Planctomycetes bacterium Poly30]